MEPDKMEEKNIACKFAEWLSAGIVSNYKSNGTWFVGVSRFAPSGFKSTEQLFNKFMELSPVETIKEEQRQHLVDLMKTDEEYSMYRPVEGGIEGKHMEVSKKEPISIFESAKAVVKRRYEKEIKDLKKEPISAEEMYHAICEAIQVIEHYDNGEDFAMHSSLRRLREIKKANSNE